MNNRKSIIGLTLAAIMVASIFAMVAPTAVAKYNPSGPAHSNSTIRIYGAYEKVAPLRYSDWTQPFDPTVIPSDSITFNPAIKEEVGQAQQNDSDIKTYLRMWYEPAHRFSQGYNPAIITEYTYMIIHNKHKTPWHAKEGDNLRYLLPIVEVSNQTGLGGYENTQIPPERIGKPNALHLAKIDGPVASYGKTVNGTIAIDKKYWLESGETVQFMDYKVKYLWTGLYGNPVVLAIYYAGNVNDEYLGLIEIDEGETKYIKRDGSTSDSFDRHHPFYVHFQFKTQEHRVGIDVGRYLWNCSIFYVNGVRYEVPAVEVLDWDGNATNGPEKLKYITIRAILPKALTDGPDSIRDDGDAVSSIWVDTIKPTERIPVLPPFNDEHKIVDDINVPLWAPLKHLDKWPEGDYEAYLNNPGLLNVEYFPCAERFLTQQCPPAAWQKYFAVQPIGAQLITDPELYENLWINGSVPFCENNRPGPTWIGWNIAKRIIDGVPAVNMSYIAEAQEERYSTNLLEKLMEEEGYESEILEKWAKFDIWSRPDDYTEFILPECPDVVVSWRADQTDHTMSLPGDYLITTNLTVAPDQVPENASFNRVTFYYDQTNETAKLDGADWWVEPGMDGKDLYINSAYGPNCKDPTCYAKNVTLRIYGGADNAPVRYSSYEQVFNPTVIRKDSITFDAAIMEDVAKAQQKDTDVKVYLRTWYDTAYHYEQENVPSVVTETTYMLIDDKHKKPWHGSAGDTWFPFPIAENESTPQIGLELFENVNGTPARPGVVALTKVEGTPDDPDGLGKTVNGTIAIQKKYWLYNDSGIIQFLDYKFRYVTTKWNGTVVVMDVWYAGNKEDVYLGQKEFNESVTYWLKDDGSITTEGPEPPRRTTFVHFEFKTQEHAVGIDVGKVLYKCSVFYVDSVRYEVTAVETLDKFEDGKCEKFKFITLRTPFPKDPTGAPFCTEKLRDDGRYASSIWITKIPPCHPIPVLPPFNEVHSIVDDTDVVLWQPLKHLDKWPAGDPHGVPGMEWFGSAGEKYLTMQEPPRQWLKFFRAVPIGVPSMPTDWQLWENYGGPFYPPENPCGDEDWQHWIGCDVTKRIIEDVEPLEFCWLTETKEPRFSTNLLEVLHETITGEGPIEERWTKYDIMTMPDEYTEFRLPVIPSIDPRVYVGGDFQDYFKPDTRPYPGSYLITTSFLAPNARGNLNINQSWSEINRFAFTFNASEGRGIYIEEDPVIEELTPTITLKKGNNYVSLPVAPNGSATPEAIFGADCEVWAYDASTGWYHPSVLEAGKGYLVRSPEDRTVEIEGTTVDIMWETIKEGLAEGWNLVGSDSDGIVIGNTTGLTVLWWNGNNWVEPDKLESGEAYWILKQP